MTHVVSLSLVLALATLLQTMAAWRDGDNGTVLWDSDCDFIGHELMHERAPSQDCGSLCLMVPTCTHFSWSTYMEGTCWLKSGDTNTARHSAFSTCGFVQDRFQVDDSRGLDLAPAPPRADEARMMSRAESDFLFLEINTMRTRADVDMIELDVRLALAAQALLERSVDSNCSVETAASGAAQVMDEAIVRGFTQKVNVLAVAMEKPAEANATITDDHALTEWLREDRQKYVIAQADVKSVGFAKYARADCLSNNGVELEFWAILMGPRDEAVWESTA